MKKCIKSRFLWNLQQMGKVIRPFCWHQNFVPWGLSVPALGLYICIKSWRKLYKIRLQRHFFETCNKWMKWQDVPVDIKISSQRGCEPLPWNLHSVPQTLLKMSEILVHIKYNSLIYIVKQELSTYTLVHPRAFSDPKLSLPHLLQGKTLIGAPVAVSSI